MDHLSLPYSLRAEIPKLRRKYKYIYLLDLGPLENNDKNAPSYVVIRPLTRREFNFYQADSLIDPLATHDEIVDRCCLWPDDPNESFKDSLAGVYNFIHLGIETISGFAKIESLNDAVGIYRQEAMTLESAITMFICKAFPKYAPSDVDEMSFEDQIKLVSLAEQILGIPINYEEFFNPKKESTKKDKSEKIRESFQEKQAKFAPPVAKGYTTTMPPGVTPQENSRPTYVPSDDSTVVTPNNINSEMEKLNRHLNG
jgi:hypothetical protein